jgi:hypothetical protein
MQRRQLLHLGAASALALSLAAAGLSILQPAMPTHPLAPEGQAVFRAVARAVLAETLPADPASQAAALQAHLQRVDTTVAGLPPAAQAELAQLLALLAHPAGRVALAGLATPWADASTERVQSALQGLRGSRFSLRRQTYHALRDLTVASYFAAPDAWALLGYPGPRPL